MKPNGLNKKKAVAAEETPVATEMDFENSFLVLYQPRERKSLKNNNFKLKIRGTIHAFRRTTIGKKGCLLPFSMQERLARLETRLWADSGINKNCHK